MSISHVFPSQELPGTDSATAGCFFAIKVINKTKMR